MDHVIVSLKVSRKKVLICSKYTKIRFLSSAAAARFHSMLTHSIGVRYSSCCCVHLFYCVNVSLDNTPSNEPSRSLVIAKNKHILSCAMTQIPSIPDHLNNALTSKANGTMPLALLAESYTTLHWYRVP